MFRRAGPYDHIQAKIDTNLPEFRIPSHRVEGVSVCVCVFHAGSYYSKENLCKLTFASGGEKEAIREDS